MKIKEGYVLNEIADTKVAIYAGDDEDGLNGFIRLNKLGVFLWEKLTAACTMEELVKAVTDKYEVDEKTALRDATAFVESLRKAKVIEEA